MNNMNSVELPHSKMAETATLGAMIIHPEVFENIINREITSKHFYNATNKIIVDLSYEVYKDRGVLDATLLLNEIAVKMSHVSGLEDYVMYLIENSGAKSGIDKYIDIIQEKYQLRQLIEFSNQVKEQAFKFDGNADEYMMDLEQELLSITRVNNHVEVIDSVQAVEDMLQDFHNAIENDGKLTGLTTGFSNFDRITNGLQDGDLMILGARPSVGKTAFAVQLALEVALRNKDSKAHVAVFSLEMPARQLMGRMTSSLSMVGYNKIKKGTNITDEYNRINESASTLKRLNIHTNDNGSITMPEIYRICRNLKKDDKLDFIVIDYLQLINSTSKSDNRQQEVSKMSRQLKQLAREMEVPILALSQLSRGLEKRENKKPMMADLRESGSLEQDADIVMFLHRDDYFNNDEDHTYNPLSETKLIIAKHRNGELAEIDMRFDKSIMKFYEVDERYGD